MAEEALLSFIDIPCHFAELREVGPMVDGRDGSVRLCTAMLYWHGKIFIAVAAGRQQALKSWAISANALLPIAARCIFRAPIRL